MNLLDFAKQTAIDFLQKTHQKWWVEVVTTEPQCKYYFGPFDSATEAKAHYSGYLEDLHNEGAQGVQSKIKRCQPKALTLVDGHPY